MSSYEFVQCLAQWGSQSWLGLVCSTVKKEKENKQTKNHQTLFVSLQPKHATDLQAHNT